METTEPTFEISPSSSVKLQVMICAYGRKGIERVAASAHPHVDGVEYLVSWQVTSEEADHPAPKALERNDFRIFATTSKGLAVNRNIALSKASAPILLIGDDDADYSEEGLRGVIDSFRAHPEADIIAFRYASASSRKQYPQESVSLTAPPKGYFVSSIEIAFRREPVQGTIWFNENFGIGATFPSGEEDIFIRDCLDAGLNGIFLPLTIARHDGTTTSERNLMLPSRPQTKGAVFLRLHPRQWPLRMLAHALRELPLWRKGLVPSPLSFCLNWIRGVRMAKRMKIFPTPGYSSFYPFHERQ